MTTKLAHDIARRATACYFGIGIDPSYLDLLHNPRLERVPAIRMIRCIIQACEAAEAPLTAADIDAAHEAYAAMAD